jgi:PAS domain S-box-containing protein
MEAALGVDRLDPVGQLRRRERQQSLVAELGRSALTGTRLTQLVEEALDAAADGLAVDRVGFFEARPDDLLVAVGLRAWEPGPDPVPVTSGNVLAHTYRAAEALVLEDVDADIRFAESRARPGREVASIVAAPVRGDTSPIGVLVAHSPRPGEFGQDDLLFMRAIANVVAVAIARHRADEARVRSEEGLRFLAEAGHTFVRTLDYRATLSALARLVVPRLADWFIVDVADDDGTFRRPAVAAAAPEKLTLLEELSRSYPPGPGSRQPAALAVMRRCAVHFPEFTPEELRETTRDERHFDLMTKLDPHSAIAVPLIARDRTLGALTFAMSESGRRYDEIDIALAEEIARRAALAIDNANLYASEADARGTAEEAQRRVEFLAESSTLLAGSLDYSETLTSVAQLAVPRIADWCIFYMLAEDGSIERVAVEHGGGRQDVVRAILAAHELNPDAPTGVPAVIRTGRSELQIESTPVTLAADVDEPEQLASELAEVEVHSTMCVPLIARGRTLGAILFVSAESKRTYGQPDLRLAEELAGRAALAVDNSRLFREAEERAEAARALAAVADGVFLVDRRGTIRVWNRAAAAITGLDAETVRGRRATEVFADWERLSGAIPVGAPTVSPQTVPFAIDGRELWLSISGVASAEGVVYAFRDVTEERRLDRLKSDFVATVSHELRTPLAAVYGAAITLAERNLSARPDLQRVLLAQIVGQTERLTAIVSDILLAGELEAGRFRLTPGEIDPVEVARAAVEAASPRVPETAQLELVAPDQSLVIETDAGRLRQVLDNLIENAIKYSPNGGRTEVRVEPGEVTVAFSVSDEGVGIPSGELERIFEKFYRLDPEQSRGVAGTGLGLYVCKELVERMEGRISVTSRLGRGSTFRVELPRR